MAARAHLGTLGRSHIWAWSHHSATRPSLASSGGVDQRFLAVYHIHHESKRTRVFELGSDLVPPRRGAALFMEEYFLGSSLASLI